jgi:hypothetical protein
VHRDATEIVTHDLAFSCMNACTNVDTELLDRVCDRLAAANCTRRAIEGR